jgi:putative CocE/NonD family hydrolase
MREFRNLFDVRVPMRDGVTLSADLYLPAAEGRHPAILQRTPYDNTMPLWVGIAQYFASRGYAFVSQDVRGRCDSDGVWEPFVNEAEDGYDTVEWVAAQPWCDGQVAMMGGSYGGLVQWLAAREGPPHLRTLVSTAAAGRIMEELPWHFGKVMPPWAMGWLNMVGGRVVQPSTIPDWDRVVRARPSRDADLALGRLNTVWREWLRHPTYDGYWRRMSMLDRFAQVDLPVLHITGWFDGDRWGQLYYWREMARRSPAAARQYLLAGPWDHAGTRTPQPRHGGLEFGEGAVVDMNAVHLRWFDYWLRGTGDAPVDFGPGARSRIFLMGENRWREDATWPPPSSVEVAFYFHSGGGANTLGGDGRLDRVAPGGEPSDQYTYNPEDATPSSPDPYDYPGGPEVLDQRWLLRRDDVVVYTSEVLTEPLELAGHPFVAVWAESDAPDTDFAATLYDVHPDGRSAALTSGIMRGSYREDSARPSAEPLRPGVPFLCRIELLATANVFGVGHRVRVAVMSARWPAYCEDAETALAHQGPDDASAGRKAAEAKLGRAAPGWSKRRDLHDAAHPSHLLAPVRA